ncbi:MAG: WS/DGAT domain-containing protein [Planctomycetaceae bacterium]
MTAVVFPLPFTPFEYYYWCDDRPDWPTTFPIELVFRGTLQRPEFEQAYRLVVARHPLLHALVDTRAARLPRWIDGSDRSAPVDWADDQSSRQPLTDAFLDLTSLPGLRVWVRVSAEQSRVVLQFHHACCDALGALQFIEELLLAYHALIVGSAGDSQLPALDPARLAQRGDYGLSTADYRPGLHDAWITARIWSNTLLRRPGVVARSRSAIAAPSPANHGRPYQTQALGQGFMEKLHATAAGTGAGATVNDLMLRDLFLVLRRWNVEHGGRRRQRLTVNMPVSLRSRVDRGMPAANSLGFWFVHRSAAECAQPAVLLDSIRNETAAVKKWRMPLYFVGGLGVAAHVPGLMRSMLRGKQSFATAVFSNVGRIFPRTPLEHDEGRLVCGNAVLERVTGVPPIRPGTRIAIVVVTYANETTINLRSDPNELSPSDAEQLLARFHEQLMISGGT